MFAVCRQKLCYDVKRVAGRSFGSVLPDLKISDFSVKNEPILDYLKGSRERSELEAAIEKISCDCVEVPIIIGDEEIRTDIVKYQVMPHDHSHKIAQYYYATPDVIKKAIKVAVNAQKIWDNVPFEKRLSIWQKAADLMASKYRMQLNAATMLGQSKNALQAEIDSAAELIDFFRFNAFNANEIMKYQPVSENPKITLNSMRYRGMEGFVAAVSPFNFTAIGGNLAFTPALMGNSVLWKPSDTALLSNYVIFKIMKEAGLPPGVVNFMPADGPVFGDAVTSSRDLSAINFTGSVATFNHLWKQVGANIDNYKSYPRLIGECGGKNYHFVHPSANIQNVVVSTIRSAFEYCGQKCSACSRMYVPESLWPDIEEGLLCARDEIKMGDPTEYDTFMGAVIDEKAFKRLAGAIDRAKKAKDLKILGGGSYDDSKGYFIEPTFVQSKNPTDDIMRNELFGPVLAIYVYQDKDVKKVLELIDTTTPYALTGAIFADDEDFLKKATVQLKQTAGNFYINDKSTGSVVGQQPFGGARMSGTNDKAGGPHYVLRYSSPMSIKETFVPYKDWKYPYMQA